MEKLPLYILCGGRSSRFGSDKARAPLQGLPLILHAARLLSPVAGSVTAVAEVSDKYKDLGLRTIADREPHLGPLGGILTALDDVADEGWILVSSCDMVDLPVEGLTRLMAARDPGRQAAAFRGPEGWQPFPLLLHATAWDAAEDLVHGRRASLRALLDRLSTAGVSPPDRWNGASGINSPQDLGLGRPPR